VAAIGRINLATCPFAVVLNFNQVISQTHRLICVTLGTKLSWNLKLQPCYSSNSPAQSSQVLAHTYWTEFARSLLPIHHHYVWVAYKERWVYMTRESNTKCPEWQWPMSFLTFRARLAYHGDPSFVLAQGKYQKNNALRRLDLQWRM
jgi:hypothetical protein